jgi:hypothetical protein
MPSRTDISGNNVISVPPAPPQNAPSPGLPPRRVIHRISHTSASAILCFYWSDHTALRLLQLSCFFIGRIWRVIIKHITSSASAILFLYWLDHTAYHTRLLQLSFAFIGRIWFVLRTLYWCLKLSCCFAFSVVWPFVTLCASHFTRDFGVFQQGKMDCWCVFTFLCSLLT